MQCICHDPVFTEIKYIYPFSVRFHVFSTVYSQSLMAVMTIGSQDISVTQKGDPVPISRHPPFPAPPLLTPTDLFLLLRICLFWTFHINGIIHYVAF